MAGKPSVFAGDTFESKYGVFSVIEYTNAKDVEVLFHTTGFVCRIEAADIRKGNVKDPLSPSVQGVGVIGVGPHKVSRNRKALKEYNIWAQMLRRCYSEGYHKKKPTYKGCKVDDRWLNYQLFCEDLPLLEGYDLFSQNLPCHLDKDIRVPGNKVYSRDTCKFVTPSENSKEPFKRK